MKIRSVGKSSNATRTACFKTVGMLIGSVRFHGAQLGERE